MNQALVQHAKNEVDDEERGGNQDRCARQRVAKCLGIALKAGLKREWLAEILLDLLDGAHRLADRRARQEVERDRYRRELALMIDHERRDLHDGVDEGR